MAGDFDLLGVQDRIWESELRHPEKAVALALVNHWSRKGKVFPGVARLARLTSLGERTVKRAIANLEDCGAIVAKRIRGKSNEYDLAPLAHLVVPERHRCQSGTSARQAPDRGHTGPGVVPHRPPNKPIKEPKKEPTNVKFALEPPTSKLIDPVTAVFEFWKRDTKHPKVKLDKKRRVRIQARLKEGFSVEELRQAIAHRRNDPWLMGEDQSPRVFDSIHTLLRDAEQVERLRDLTERRASAPYKTKGYQVQNGGELVHLECETYAAAETSS